VPTVPEILARIVTQLGGDPFLGKVIDRTRATTNPVELAALLRFAPDGVRGVAAWAGTPSERTGPRLHTVTQVVPVNFSFMLTANDKRPDGRKSDEVLDEMLARAGARLRVYRDLGFGYAEVEHQFLRRRREKFIERSERFAAMKLSECTLDVHVFHSVTTC
jgi:hypothetical protein